MQYVDTEYCLDQSCPSELEAALAAVCFDPLWIITIVWTLIVTFGKLISQSPWLQA